MGCGVWGGGGGGGGVGNYQNKLAKIYHARNQIHGGNFQVKLCTCAHVCNTQISRDYFAELGWGL